MLVYGNSLATPVLKPLIRLNNMDIHCIVIVIVSSEHATAKFFYIFLDHFHILGVGVDGRAK